MDDSLLVAESRKPRFFYGYVIVSACFVMMVVWWGSFHSFGVFFESLLAEFGWSRAVTVGAFSLHGVVFGLFSIPIARLCSKFSPQLVIGVCGFLGGLGYVLMSQISAVWQIYLLYGLPVSLGMGGYISILPVVARWFVRRRGLMTGVVFSGMGIGMVLLPPMVSQLIAAYGWRLSYVFIGLIVMVGVVAGAQFLRLDPHQIGRLAYGENRVDTAGPVSRTRGFTLREALRTSQFWMIGAFYFVYLVSHNSVTAHVVIHATDMGVLAINAARLLAVFGALLILGFNIIGMTADRIGNKSGFIISFILMILAFVLVILNREVWALYPFVGVLGFACGGMQVLFSPIAAELFGLSSHGVILAAVGFIGGLGSAVGAAMAGYIFDVTGSYHLAFIICAFLAVVAFITALLLRPLRSRGGTSERKGA